MLKKIALVVCLAAAVEKELILPGSPDGQLWPEDIEFSGARAECPEDHYIFGLHMRYSSDPLAPTSIDITCQNIMYNMTRKVVVSTADRADVTKDHAAYKDLNKRILRLRVCRVDDYIRAIDYDTTLEEDRAVFGSEKVCQNDEDFSPSLDVPKGYLLTGIETALSKDKKYVDGIRLIYKNKATPEPPKIPVFESGNEDILFDTFVVTGDSFYSPSVCTVRSDAFSNDKFQGPFGATAGLSDKGLVNFQLSCPADDGLTYARADQVNDLSYNGAVGMDYVHVFYINETTGAIAGFGVGGPKQGLVGDRTNKNVTVDLAQIYGTAYGETDGVITSLAFYGIRPRCSD